MQETTNRKIQVRVIKKQIEAESICSFELADVSGAQLPAYVAGAHINVYIHGLIRQYSLCNEPAVAGNYRIAVLREPTSRGGSLALHDVVHEGDCLSISGPHNHFPLEPGTHHSLLFAGGIGITPIFSMAQALWTSGAPFEMHYSIRSKERAAFLADIQSSMFANRVHFHFDDGPVEQKLNLLDVLNSVSQDTHLYVCGPAGFLESMLVQARAAGWSERRLHKEYFVAPDSGLAVTEEKPADEFEVCIASTGKRYVIAANMSITDVLREHGIEISVSCEEGICGTCLTRVLSGIPDHRDLFLTPDEKATNKIFTPCCSRAKDKCLVLDL